MKRFVIVVALGIVAATSQYGAEVRHLTLTEAVHLAVSRNRSLKIARLKVTENEQKKAGQHSAYFPHLTNQSNFMHVTDLQNISIPAGAFGTVGGLDVPAQNRILPQGQTTLVFERYAAIAAADAAGSGSMTRIGWRLPTSPFRRTT